MAPRANPFLEEEEEGPQQEGTQQARKRVRSKAAHKGNTVNWELSEAAQKALVHHNKAVLLATVEFDLALALGQPRRLDDDIVQSRVQDLRNAPPVDPLGGFILLPKDVQGKAYVALGGQHTIKAMQQIQEEYLAARRKLPAWLTTIHAKVLRYQTEKALCAEWAGWHQHTQAAVASMPLSRWCACYLSLLPMPPMHSQVACPQPTHPSDSTSAPSPSSHPPPIIRVSAGSSSSTTTTNVSGTGNTTDDRLQRIILATKMSGMKRQGTDVCSVPCPGLPHARMSPCRPD